MPGLQSVATAIAHAVTAEAPRPAALRLAQQVERARQQHRDGAGRAPSPRRRPRRCIRGGRPRARRSAPRARRRRRSESWSACSLTGRPRPLRRREDARGLLGREGDPLAEGVDRVGEPFRARSAGSISSQISVDVRVLVAVAPRAAAHARRGRSVDDRDRALRARAGARRAAVAARSRFEAVAAT